MSELVIRDAALTDAPALWSIYKPYVEKTVITFETEVPTVEEFGRRIQKGPGSGILTWWLFWRDARWGTPMVTRLWAGLPTIGRRN